MTGPEILRWDGGMSIGGKPVLKIWESFGGWYWYAIEDQGVYTYTDPDGGKDKECHSWFGFVQGDEDEWGTFDSNLLDNNPKIWPVPKKNWAFTGRMDIAT